MAAAAVATVVFIPVVVVAVLPLNWVRSPVERAASNAFGRRVSIAGMARLNTFSLSPIVRLEGIRIAQPTWAGPGDMATIADARISFAVADLFRGHLVPLSLDIDGAQVALVRDASGRSNWAGEPSRAVGGEPRPATPPRLRHLGIANTMVRLHDLKRHVDITATIASDSHGLAIIGAGTQRGQPLRVTAHGGALERIDPMTRYPFAVEIASPLVNIVGRGTMDHALDAGHFTVRLATRGHDLINLDDIIEAGVPATQAFALTATVRHNDYDWLITDLAGTIGRSDLAGRLSVKRRQSRSLLDGAVTANAFDFDDLASDEQLARGKAEEARIGKRIVPATAIHFEKLGQTDGVIRFHAGKLLSKSPSPFVALDATLVMDHRRLVVKPLTARLTHGMLTGDIVVDHRGGSPKLTATLDLVGARIEDLFNISPQRATVPVDGRIRLHGSGDTVRAALGRGSGTLDLSGRGGGIDYKVATLAAGDVVRGLGLAISGDSDRLTPIRCIDARFVARDGVFTARDLILDTMVMRADGEGTLRLPDETLALTLRGRSKHPDVIQSTVPIHIGGTLARATFDVVPVDRSAPKRSLLGRVGDVLKSLKVHSDADRGNVAPDAPCNKLRVAALGQDWAHRHPN
ncbi:AsmA family protein [Glacieibacterium megasporae]|uniref:AsmA family protein n=1 Tax=Glacieibacterium megasporae TaxID=2835787 RepID=UPI001C1E5E8E|nr:AsmA family protein [Polymorphobacter megasporae]UAJ09916.1 AsmA family protein [Polymorphobacter megasporae]